MTGFSVMFAQENFGAVFRFHLPDLELSNDLIKVLLPSGTLPPTELFTAHLRYPTNNSQLVEVTMDWNRVEGNWKQIKGKIKEKWGQLTDDDLQQVNGKRDQLEGKIQERYGIAKDRARKDIDDWLKTMG